jgi:hypothetical protein
MYFSRIEGFEGADEAKKKCRTSLRRKNMDLIVVIRSTNMTA